MTGVERQDRSLAFSETMAATPIYRELMESARHELEEGIPRERVKERTKGRLAKMELGTYALFFRGVNRKVLRYPAPKFIRKLGEHLAAHTRSKKVRDLLDKFSKSVGYDDWAAEFFVHWAETGEVLPFYDNFFGGVWETRLTLNDEKVPMVGIVAGPASDIEGLIEEFRRKCQQTLPKETFERSANELRDARWFRAFHEGTSDAEIAWDELAQLHPSEIVFENPKFRPEHRRAVNRIKQARKRWEDKVTAIVLSPSPDSETG